MSTTPTLAREMASEDEISPSARFATARLPWIIGAVAFLVFLLTLNHWMAFASTAQIAKASGWAWQPELQAPINWLILLPFRWLPASVVPQALNVLSALMATLTLMLLARSVSLLPHDRTLAQRERQRDPMAILSIPWAWIPPVFAVLLCGFQLSFWESATNATTVGSFAVSNSMLDLLLFAYVIRCLLEYRIDERSSWLVRSSFVFGLAMTNDWAMIGFFPLFLTAMVWIVGRRFTNPQILTRLFLAGIAGLLFYFLLPIVAALSDDNLPFWYSLRYNLGNQRYMLLMFLASKQSLLPLFLTSFVPILWIGIRWPNSLGDTSPRGIAFAKFLFHFVHAFFLLACAWVALDPPASPRNQQLGVRFLTFYYLGALSAGYFVGYFLLIFGPHQPSRIARRLIHQGRMVNTLTTASIVALAVLIPVLLLFRNLPHVRQTNGPLLRDYARTMAEGLPEGAAMVISDDVQRAMLIEAARAKTGKGKQWLVVVSSALKDPPYHRYLKERYGEQWPYELPKSGMPVSDQSILSLISEIAHTRPIYYLQPSFGYFFENNFHRPRGLVYEVLPYKTKELRPPPLTEDLIQANRVIWDQFDAQVLPQIAKAVNEHSEDSPLKIIWKPLRLKPQSNRDLALLGTYYSRALNHWGVELQKIGRLEDASRCFEKAIELNPNNRVAQVNLENSRKLALAGRVDTADHLKAEEVFISHSDFNQIVAHNGPFDDPFFCNAHAQKFYSGNNYRQAGQLFLRATELDPNFLAPYLSLGLVYVLGKQQEKALAILNGLRARPEMQESLRREKAEVMYLEAVSYLNDTNETAAAKVIQSTLSAHPGDSNVVWAATMVYMGKNMFAQALQVVNDQLPKLQVKNTTLLNKGWLAIQLQDFQQAREAMDELIATETTNTEVLQRAYLNRAISLLQLGLDDQAAEDYKILQSKYPNFLPTSVYYGLGDIAFRKGDTNAAIYNYELYMSSAVTDGVVPEELRLVTERLKKLKPDSR